MTTSGEHNLDAYAHVTNQIRFENEQLLAILEKENQQLRILHEKDDSLTQNIMHNRKTYAVMVTQFDEKSVRAEHNLCSIKATADSMSSLAKLIATKKSEIEMQADKLRFAKNKAREYIMDYEQKINCQQNALINIPLFKSLEEHRKLVVQLDHQQELKNEELRILKQSKTAGWLAKLQQNTPLTMSDYVEEQKRLDDLNKMEQKFDQAQLKIPAMSVDHANDTTSVTEEAMDVETCENADMNEPGEDSKKQETGEALATYIQEMESLSLKPDVSASSKQVEEAKFIERKYEFGDIVKDPRLHKPMKTAASTSDFLTCQPNQQSQQIAPLAPAASEPIRSELTNDHPAESVKQPNRDEGDQALAVGINTGTKQKLNHKMFLFKIPDRGFKANKNCHFSGESKINQEEQKSAKETVGVKSHDQKVEPTKTFKISPPLRQKVSDNTQPSQNEGRMNKLPSTIEKDGLDQRMINLCQNKEKEAGSVLQRINIPVNQSNKENEVGPAQKLKCLEAGTAQKSICEKQPMKEKQASCDFQVKFGVKASAAEANETKMPASKQSLEVDQKRGNQGEEQRGEDNQGEEQRGEDNQGEEQRGQASFSFNPFGGSTFAFTPSDQGESARRGLPFSLFGNNEPSSPPSSQGFSFAFGGAGEDAQANSSDGSFMFPFGGDKDKSGSPTLDFKFPFGSADDNKDQTDEDDGGQGFKFSFGGADEEEGNNDASPFKFAFNF